MFLFFRLENSMKKSALWIILPLVVLVAWCLWGWDKTNITENKFEAESCNQYFEMMSCILDNANDESYSESLREDLRQDIISMQEERKNLDQETLSDTCSAELSRFDGIQDSLAEIGCAVR